MDQPLKMTRKQLLIASGILALVLLFAIWRWQVAEERRREEEIATAEGIVRVLTATFAGRTDLKVADIKGTIDVTSVDRGLVFKTKQKATLPFSVDYFLDLSALDPRKARFDNRSRTLFVELPDVRIAPPNVDWTKGKVDKTEGYWVSRGASSRLVYRALVLAQRQATTTASKPENLAKARAEARTRITTLLEFPFNAVGQDKVRVVVRLPDEGSGNSEQWDVSPSIAEVLARHKAR